MLKLKFASGTELEYDFALETEEFYNGASRRTLTFELEREKVNLEQLDGECTESNLENLTASNSENGASAIYTGYVLKLALGTKQKLANAETNEYKEIVELKLGKRTYIEEQLHKLGIN